jgi:hypothetical protein
MVGAVDFRCLVRLDAAIFETFRRCLFAIPTEYQGFSQELKRVNPALSDSGLTVSKRLE